MAKFAKNDLVSVTIDDLAYGGLGIGRVDGFVVMVDQALPGERVSARIYKKKGGYAQGRIEAIEQPSPHRITDPPCPRFGRCGGCTWQNFPYDQQLIWKQKQVVDVIERIGGQRGFELHPIIGSPLPFRYRNKMEYSFGYGDAGEIVLGFHLPGRFDVIFDVPTCHLQPEPFDGVLQVFAQWALENKLTAYDQRRHDGFLRHVVLRHSATTGEWIAVLLTTHGELPAREMLVERLQAIAPGLKGFVWGYNTGVSDVARIEQEAWVWGEPILTETVNGLTFSISPQSFFQTNTLAAALLYARTVEMAELSPQDRVLDAYCGAGTIGLHCARTVEKVVGIEVITEAIWNARANAAANGIENATFIAAPLKEGLPLARHAASGDFTRVIIDPPRGGMDKKSLAGLIEVGAEVFVYVSCNPATLGRDIQTICAAGYKLETVQPVDMFPQTYHVETIVRLRKS